MYSNFSPKISFFFFLVFTFLDLLILKIITKNSLVDGNFIFFIV